MFGKMMLEKADTTFLRKIRFDGNFINKAITKKEIIEMNMTDMYRKKCTVKKLFLNV